jgi:hypothetical protein
MKIFISWSKTYSGEIAKALQTWLEEAFESKITTFISSEGIESGKDWFREISDQLGECELGILVLTPENINSPWIMYEAGALSTKKAIIPVLFERSADRVEGPISKRNHVTYSKKGFKKLLIDMNKHINAGVSAKALNAFIETEWDYLQKKIDPLVEKARIALPTIEKEGLKSTRQDGVDLSTGNVFTVSKQTSVGVSAEEVFPLNNMKVKDIPIALKKFAHENLDSEYCIKEQLNSGDTQTRFMINRTRISNFISFTDGERIAFFDRKNSSDNTMMVKNSKLDVFGAVHFENGSMLGIKITNTKFNDVSVQSINEIPGFAFEDNESNSLERETVMMFGYSAKVSSDDLNLIVSDTADSKIYLKNTFENMPKSITAKAELAYKYIARTRKT